MNRWLTAADHQHVDLTILACQALIDVGKNACDWYDATQTGGRACEAVRAAQIALLSDVFEQNTGMLGLHLAQALKVGSGKWRKVAGRVRRVNFGWRSPFFQVAHDFG